MAATGSSPLVEYHFGHHPTVTEIHAHRTAKKCASYLLPHIKPHHRILDVGCGPGSITIDFASFVPEGFVMGIDPSASVISEAQRLAKDRNVLNCEFKVGDAYKLEAENESFDIVHCHQCLIHLSDPAKALKEMKRVCKSGGIVAAREGDFGNMPVYPEIPALVDGIQKILGGLIRSGGSEPCAGRRLKAWGLNAGFSGERTVISGSVDIISTQEERKFFGGSYADRFSNGSLGKKAVDLGLVSEDKRAEIEEAWRMWGEGEDGFHSITHTQLLYHKE